jgi:hypothetical protein
VFERKAKAGKIPALKAGKFWRYRRSNKIAADLAEIWKPSRRATPTPLGFARRQTAMHDCCQRMQDSIAGAGESKQLLHQRNMWYVNQDWYRSQGGNCG